MLLKSLILIELFPSGSAYPVASKMIETVFEQSYLQNSNEFEHRSPESAPAGRPVASDQVVELAQKTTGDGDLMIKLAPLIGKDQNGEPFLLEFPSPYKTEISGYYDPQTHSTSPKVAHLLREQPGIYKELFAGANPDSGMRPAKVKLLRSGYKKRTLMGRGTLG